MDEGHRNIIKYKAGINENSGISKTQSLSGIKGKSTAEDSSRSWRKDQILTDRDGYIEFYIQSKA